MRRLLIAALVLLSQAARAERAPLAVLWLGAPDERVQSAIDGALGGSRELRPLDDEAARRVLLDGGAGSRVAALVADGKARFASLTALDEADRRLAEAESVALRAMPIAEACPRLVEIETLRLRYAELQLDAGAAARAARILAACAPSPSPELAAAIARHPAPPAPAQPPARVESEPPGATVFLDLRPIGKTPIDLPPARRPDALLDVELPGFRKVHREAPSSGVLAVVLSRGEDLGALVDGARAEAER